MRTIAKGREPQSLTAHRKTAHSDYGNYGHKDELRTALVAEQRGLCCYCMDRIRNDRVTKIEHWRPRGASPTNNWCTGTCSRRAAEVQARLSLNSTATLEKGIRTSHGIRLTQTTT